MTQPSCLRYLVAFKELDIPQDAILYLLSLPSHVAQHSKSSCKNPPVCAAVHQCQEIPGTGHIFPLPTAFPGFENCWKFLFLAYLLFLVWLMHGVYAGRHGHACDLYFCKSRNRKTSNVNQKILISKLLFFFTYLPNSVRSL